MNDLSYWAATSMREKTYSDAPIPDKVDVAIIGGGYTGLSAGLHLAKYGAKAVVFDAEHIGWGASSRNGGMVLPGFKADLHTLIQRLGLDKTRHLYDHSLAAIALVKSLIAENKIECELEETGYIYAATKPSHFKSLVGHQHELEHAFNHSTRVLPRAEQRKEVGSDLFHGVLVDDSAAGVHPAKYVNGLAQAADNAGVALVDKTPVQKLVRRGDDFEVITMRGTVRAKDVIVATNGYTGGIVPWLQRRVVPVGSYITVTEPLSPELAYELIPNRRMAFDTKNMLYYWRVLKDNRLLFGGRASFIPTDTTHSAEILGRGIVEVYPQLKDTKIEYSWGGKLGFTMDLMPHAGRRDGVFYAMGYGGHGVALATYMGKKLADRICGKDSTLPLEDLRFWPIPLYQGWPWFLPFAGLYYETLDKIS